MATTLTTDDIQAIVEEVIEQIMSGSVESTDYGDESPMTVPDSDEEMANYYLGVIYDNGNTADRKAGNMNILAMYESFAGDAVADVDAHVETKKTELDTYTATKESELDSYVDSTSKASINDYVTTTVKTAIDSYAEDKVDAYVNDTAKAEIDSYVTAKKDEIDSYVESTSKATIDSYVESNAKPAIDSYVTTKEDEIDSYTTEKKTELDTYVAAASSSASSAASSATSAQTAQTTVESLLVQVRNLMGQIEEIAQEKVVAPITIEGEMYGASLHINGGDVFLDISEIETEEESA